MTNDQNDRDMKTTKIEKCIMAMCAAYIIGRLAVSLIFSI